MLIGCVSMHTANSFYYQQKDNPSVALLEFYYSDFHQKTRNPNHGITTLSFSTLKLGSHIKIKWKNIDNDQENTRVISLEKGMPFNLVDSSLRLTFNKLNQPEVYVFYQNLNAPVYFEFLNVPYSKESIRQIYPEIKEVSINNNKN